MSEELLLPFCCESTRTRGSKKKRQIKATENYAQMINQLTSDDIVRCVECSYGTA